MIDAAGVTLLITHFNRPKSLQRLLAALQELGCTFAETLVSDDGSSAETLVRLQELQREYSFRLITAAVNKGLQNNLNRGLDLVRTEYTLYVQEDFCPTAQFAKNLGNAVAILDERKDVDIVRMYAYVKYPYLKHWKDGYSEMDFSLWRPGSAKFFCYSDTPHLRRKSFFQKFGRYVEGLPAIKGEKRMVMSFLQSQGKALVCEVNDSFIHENSDTEPSTQDYGAFLRLKRLIPETVFDLLWTAKLTCEYVFKRYRN